MSEGSGLGYSVDFGPGPGNPRNSEGDTLLLEDGRLFLVWTRFRGPEDHAAADLYACHSADWGRSWTAPYLLVSGAEAAQNVMSVSLLRERRTGDALLFCLRKDGPEDLSIWVRRSADEGHTWGAARRVTVDRGYHVMNNARVVQTSGGRLVAPAAVSPRSGGPEPSRAVCYLSDDAGVTWRPSAGAVGFAEGDPVQEPGVVQPLPGGSLFMLLRTLRGHVYGARSEDEGETWSPPERLSDLPAPAAPASVARLPDGALIVAYNHRPDGATAGWADRTPLALARSEDGGRTWQRLADIEPDPAYCYGYTSLRPYGYQVVLTYYVWPRRGQRHFQDTALRVRVLPSEHLA